ncbi:MAG: Rrf2 family transcriptional regulator [Kiritimatiellae bacterium]|nr:Rrf2 family transcriptional regulator [Kiritimatiellia bacterium]
MKISAKSRYSLRILFDIALHEVEAQPRTIRQIADSQQISEKFISRLVVPMRNAGMIHSVRGVQGGFRLAKSPSDITLLDIVETEQGPVTLVSCLAKQESTLEKPEVVAKGVWGDVNNAFRNILASITLANILDRYAPVFTDNPQRLDELIYCI